MSLSRLLFSRDRRLTLKKDFTQMFSDGVRATHGPLLVYVRKNTSSHSRLGLSVPKLVGNAVKRNRIKRRCREAFRLVQDQLENVDILLTLRPHEMLSVEEYATLILKAAKT